MVGTRSESDPRQINSINDFLRAEYNFEYDNPFKSALKDMFWYRLDEMGAHFQADVNENQIRNLDSGAKKTIEQYSAEALEYFGYI